MRQSGVTNRVTRLLRDAGVRTTVFAGVRPNPHSDEVDVAVTLVRRHACDVVVGLGGGSAIDAAKAVAVSVNPQRRRPLVGRTLDPESAGCRLSPFRPSPAAAPDQQRGHRH